MCQLVMIDTNSLELLSKIRLHCLLHVKVMKKVKLLVSVNLNLIIRFIYYYYVKSIRLESVGTPSHNCGY